MKQTPTRAGLTHRLLLAAVLLVPTFGAGVLVGRLLLGRNAPAEEQRAEAQAGDADADALAACRQELTTLPKTRTVSSADAETSALEPAARIESLKTQIKACRKSEVLVNAEICSAAGRHYAAITALPDNGVLCIQRARAASFIEEDFEKCDGLEDIPNDLDLDALTKEERNTVVDAIKVHNTIAEDELHKRLSTVYETCFKTAEKNTHL